MIPTEHEKQEWARCAQAAYSAGHNNIGDKMSDAAALRSDQRLLDAQFDEFASIYRNWLVWGRFGKVS